MKNLNLLILILFFIPKQGISQANCSNCNIPCTGNANNCCVSTAQHLYDALTIPGNLDPSGATVNICGIINLGDLVPLISAQPDIFPLVVPPCVTLQGDYSFYNYNRGGTTINFPFLYQGGLKCGHQQFANVNDMPPGGDNNGDEPIADDEQMAHKNNSNSSPPPPRKPKPVTTPPIDFTIKPNPSALGITLTGSIQNLPANQSYQVSIYTPEGTLAYLGNGYTSEFTISKTLPAGVYYVKVWGKGFSNYKRIVVVG
ncbi:MAG: T9SS type A sorting domain-containing protein [Bacteroidetes bacterium]|nr:T9SS type A sorting domain-containing protein [Bacteroidota bacterium]